MFTLRAVALRKESVDRNAIAIFFSAQRGKVALRKESVDRNKPIACVGCHPHVALRKESVDRNRAIGCCICTALRRSPQGERG